ncbi:hypothetical protein GJ699_08320 [Duganella sp. FT80W]|uniref:Uncharacterized protein n=1 Tax=Duganella guangzhouensis TaxID=2666084 RepID=A0A6I2KZS5_9BURK|nr:hypothetical protein [Duganella guangzhouensis]MRW89984.1 hypothetical protein [Duganella guangzhouensis]
MNDYQPILKRAGLLMLLLATLQVAIAVWNFLQHQGTSFNIGLTALVFGALLMWGRLGGAEFVRWFAWLTWMAPLLTLYLMLAQPSGLTLAELRSDAAAYLCTMTLLLIETAITLCVALQLGQPVVLQARAAEGRKQRRIWIPQALGVAGVLAGALFSTLMLGGADARHAEALAASQFGPQYHYRINSLHVMKSPSGTQVNATVMAWNDQSLRAYNVNWRE